MSNKFTNFILHHTPQEPPLPLFHTMDVYQFKEIISGDQLELKPSPCHIFDNEKLLYLFYGRPAYKINEFKNISDQSSTDIIPHYPVCLIFKPNCIKHAKRIYPFDSGAFDSGLFNNKCDLKDFLIDPHESFDNTNIASKIVSTFFSNNSSYYHNIINKNMEDFPEVECYHNLIKNNEKIPYDDRRSTIEVQFDAPIKLSKDTVWAIILPYDFIQDEYVKNLIVNDWGAEIIIYKNKDIGQQDETYYFIKEKILNFLIKKGLVSHTPTTSYALFNLSVKIIPEIITLGNIFEFRVTIEKLKDSNEKVFLLEIPQDEITHQELNILLTAPKCKLECNNVISIPLVSLYKDTQNNDEEYNIKNQIVKTTETIFKLVPLSFGSNTIKAEIYVGNNFLKTIEKEIFVEPINKQNFLKSFFITTSKPSQRPGIILNIHAEKQRNNLLKFYFYFDDNIYVSSNVINFSNYYSVKHNFAIYKLFKNRPFPNELQKIINNIKQNKTMLFFVPPDLLFIWELLYNGQLFLCERFVIGRWLQELNNQIPHDFSVGTISIAYYANVEHPDSWNSLLQPYGAPSPEFLPGGMLEKFDQAKSLNGLHIIRYGQRQETDHLQDAPIPIHGDIDNYDLDNQLLPIKLNLHQNRPLVSLSYISRGKPELTQIEHIWAPAFLRAGCSAFVGPIWTVSPEVDAAFISTFYSRLWAGDSLGQAFQNAKMTAKAAVPDSIDWLAFVLYGDPMARPYRPVKGNGYATVEAIGREMDAPLQPDTPARFRVTLRRKPPVWHEERVIEVAENFEFENLQCHIVAFGLCITPESHIEMKRTPNGDYLGWFTLTIPREAEVKSFVIQVHYADGMKPVHNVTFSVKTAEEGE